MIEKLLRDIETTCGLSRKALKINDESKSFGDISVVLYGIAKQQKTHLEKLYEEFSEKLKMFDLIQKTELQSGYLNVWLMWRTVFERLVRSRREIFTTLPVGEKKSILVEYSQPNTHKPFHVGHLRNACLGSALVNLLEKVGHKVVAINYPGDVGVHVARCIWYLEKFKPMKPPTKLVDFLGECYFQAVNLVELEHLTKFPYFDCFFAQVRKKVYHGYEAAIKNSGKTVLVSWAGDDLPINSWTVIVNKASKLFPLLPKELQVGEWALLPAKFLDGVSDLRKPFFVVSEPTDDLPIVHFRVGGQPENFLETWETWNEEVSVVLNSIESEREPWYSLWKETRNWCLEDFRKIYDWLGCRFDCYFFESDLTKDSLKIVEEGLKRNLFYEENGAVIVNLDSLGKLVLRKKDGSVLYATRDLALAFLKSERFDYDKSIYVVDRAQEQHFKQVFKTLEKMGFPDIKKLFHLGYALVVTRDGKISSRSKNYLTFWQLKDLAVSQIISRYYDGKLSDENLVTAEKLAKACIRYGMLKVDNNSPVVFDMDEWLNVQGDSGAYILYTYARFKSMTQKANLQLAEKTSIETLENYNFSSDEIEVLRLVAFLDYYVHDACQNFSPNIVCNYTYRLCQTLNRLYNKSPILKAQEPERSVRLVLSNLATTALEICFDILGIDPLERV
ncbi:MAG: arginine--tRNA ligase [Deltaproteobacteria bacterium]|nr:arginine--tRNA ligase [Deltaproteobacteria bacterium]MCX7953186.1 arginine--tRNA ligase [Deltaproteobacteria bacterium]